MNKSVLPQEALSILCMHRRKSFVYGLLAGEKRELHPFHFYATGITPAMSVKAVGKGSQYAFTYRDSNSNPLDGAKNYKVNVPADVPAKDFWSFTLYDNQTRSMLQTDAQFPAIGSDNKSVVKNEDGSYDVYFGPTAPGGKESNWVQTVPGKGWNTIFRLYGPLESWFDQTWRPGEIKLIEYARSDDDRAASGK